MKGQDECCGQVEKPLVVVAGQTGCAKTELLKQVPASVDLEGLAHHRGSTFGKRPGGQPAQIGFENVLAVDLLRHEAFKSNMPVVLEDESLLIGRCALPEILRNQMANAPLAIVEASFESRVEHSYSNYILDKLSEWQAFLGEDEGFAAFADDLRQSMSKVERRLGGVRHRAITELLEKAIRQHEQGSPELHREWIGHLLEQYYDPMYQYQLSRKKGRLVMRGSFDEVRDYLNSLSDSDLKG